MKHLFGCHFKHLWKKRNSIVTFQLGHLTEQPTTMYDLGCFELKMFRNCPIRIEIITSSHIFILFLPRVVNLCLKLKHHLTTRDNQIKCCSILTGGKMIFLCNNLVYLLFYYDVRQTLWVQTRGKNNINIWPITS